MVVTMGIMSGKMILKKVMNAPAPSMAADSSSDSGTVLMKPWNMKTPDGIPSPQYMTIKPIGSFMLRSVARATSGTMMTWNGMTMKNAKK